MIECVCEYNYEGLLEKHNRAVHGNIKIFCHYFNNDKDCPFEDQCIFAHEESPACKFGGGCERILCMFQHDDKEETDDEDNDDVDENDENDGNNDENDDSTNEDNMITIEDIEPSMLKVEEAMRKVDELLKK